MQASSKQFYERYNEILNLVLEILREKHSGNSSVRKFAHKATGNLFSASSVLIKAIENSSLKKENIPEVSHHCLLLQKNLNNYFQKHRSSLGKNLIKKFNEPEVLPALKQLITDVEQKKLELILKLSKEHKTLFEEQQDQMMQFDEKDYIDQRMPDELLLRIFSFLNTKEISAAGGVSKRWNNIASTPELKVKVIQANKLYQEGVMKYEARFLIDACKYFRASIKIHPTVKAFRALGNALNESNAFFEANLNFEKANELEKSQKQSQKQEQSTSPSVNPHTL